MRILLLDDDISDDIGVRQCLAEPDRCFVSSPEDGPIDLAIADSPDVPVPEGTPVIVLGADGAPEKIIEAMRGGAYAWFPKSFLPAALREMADRALTAPRLHNAIEVLSASPPYVELRLRCEIETASRVLHFLRQIEPPLPEPDRENLAMAFREILFNAVEHGGGQDPNLYVTVTYLKTETALLFLVRDPGPGFSFGDLPHAAVSHPDSPVEHALNRQEMGMRPGGFGIMLTRSFVDELLYNEKGNEALLIKYLKPR